MDIESTQPNPTPEPAAPKTPFRLSRKTVKILAAVGACLAVVVVATSLVYLRPPTDPVVRGIARVLPYPAAVVAGDVITVEEYIEERDALNTYFETTLSETGTVPTEVEITRNIMETLVHKVAVRHIAEVEGVTLDEARVEAFYQDAIGGADPEEFAMQLQDMFGWTPEDFRARVIGPVVLAMQVSDHVAVDADRQAGRRATADAAYARLEAGDDFAVIASDMSADFPAAQGGDVGYVKTTDMPPDWQEMIGALEIGGHSSVIDADESYLLFLVTDRVTAGEDAQVKLSLISVPKLTLEELVQEYLESARVWKFIGRT